MAFTTSNVISLCYALFLVSQAAYRQMYCFGRLLCLCATWVGDCRQYLQLIKLFQMPFVLNET